MHKQDPAAFAGEDYPALTTAMPIDRLNRHIALGIVVLLFVIVIIGTPFANTPLPRVDIFIPVLQTVMCVVDLITAAILFAQYSIGPKFALLAVASGYVFSGLFAFLQTLAFPGAYSASGLIGDGVSTAAWLFVFWHASFDCAVAVYALTKDKDEAPKILAKSSGFTIGITIALVCAAAFGLTWIVTAGAKYLPTLYSDLTKQTSFASRLDIFLWAFNAAVLLLLYVRRRTILDLWLIVILLVWWPNFVLPSFVTVVRFTLGWYVARGFALFASSTLLVVLLAESMALYARLANSLRLLGRVRADRLASLDAATAAMAHEISQPLGAIANYSATAAILLERTPQNVTEAIEHLHSVDENIGIAEDRIVSVRKLFDRGVHQRAAIEVGTVVEHTLALLERDLKTNRIQVVAEYQDHLPPVIADYGQLQQVVFNVAKNAIEAMASSSAERRLRFLTGSNDSTVSLYIQDSGPGISSENQSRIFDAFFTTKGTGMGLGLPICQAIIQEHGGELKLAKTGPTGTSFEIVLPVDQSGDSHR